MITNEKSRQYKILHSNQCYVNVNGIYHYDDYVCVALGSNFGDVGDKLILHYENGQSLKVIITDWLGKDITSNNCHTDDKLHLMEVLCDLDKFKSVYPNWVSGRMEDYDKLVNSKLIYAELVEKSTFVYG